VFRDIIKAWAPVLLVLVVFATLGVWKLIELLLWLVHLI
jgi:hypothetical protein